MTSLPIHRLRLAAQHAFSAYADEGMAAHPAAVPSHICIRTADDAAYRYFSRNAKALGTVVRRTHDGKPLLWVKLADPLHHDGQMVEWLEITAPKPEANHETGPQMLVFKLAASGTLKRPSRTNSAFTLRFQPLGAAELAL